MCTRFFFKNRVNKNKNILTRYKQLFIDTLTVDIASTVNSFSYKRQQRRKQKPIS